MKMNTPSNKRKSDVGGGPKSNTKKRKSSFNGSSDVSFDLASQSTATKTPPSQKKNMKMFPGTSAMDSPKNTPQKKNQAQSVDPKSKLENSIGKKKAKKLNVSNSSETNAEGVSPNKTQLQKKRTSSEGNQGDSPNKKQKKAEKKHKISKEIVEKFSKRRRNSYLSSIKTRLDTVPKDTLIVEIQERMDNITKRKELTKSAKRKLGHLKRLMFQAKGEGPSEKSAVSAEAKKNKKNKKQQKAKASTLDADKTESTKVKKVIKGKPKTEDAEDEAEQSSSEEELLLQSESNENLEADSDDDNADASDDDNADASDDDNVDASDDEEDESGDKSEDEDEDEEGDEEEDESEGESDDNEESTVVPKSKVQPQQNKLPAKKNKDNANNKNSNGDATNKQKQRYVLFVGNLPFDATEADINTHFAKAGKIQSIRIPKGQDNKPRGFAYVEVTTEEAYQKAFSMHQTFIKGRQIKVEYTKGGNKNSETAKKEIKVKNAKLHALRKDGKLAGSKKENQKRSFRRKKAAQSNGKPSNM